MWDRFECSGRCLRRVVCQGCWCRSFPKKSLDPVLAPKVNRMTIFSIVFNKKNEGLWNDGFSCVSPCFALTSWRLKHLTPGDHFCRIWTLEPFFCRSPTKSCTSGRTQDQASAMPTGMETEPGLNGLQLPDPRVQKLIVAQLTTGSAWFLHAVQCFFYFPEWTSGKGMASRSKGLNL